jgi:hypothetical protein
MISSMTSLATATAASPLSRRLHRLLACSCFTREASVGRPRAMVNCNLWCLFFQAYIYGEVKRFTLLSSQSVAKSSLNWHTDRGLTATIFGLFVLISSMQIFYYYGEPISHDSFLECLCHLFRTSFGLYNQLISVENCHFGFTLKYFLPLKHRLADVTTKFYADVLPSGYMAVVCHCALSTHYIYDDQLRLQSDCPMFTTAPRSRQTSWLPFFEAT